MKLRKSLIIAATASAALLAGAGVAVAQDNEQTPSCAEALRVYVQADKVFKALPEKVPNLELPGLSKKVEDAQSVVTTRQGKLTDATKAATQGGTGLVDGDLNRAKIEQLTKEYPVGHPAHATAQAQIAFIQAVLTAKTDLASAQAALDSATKNRQDAPAKVDNPALKKGPEFDALNKTKTDADKACEGQPGDPGTVDPNAPGGNDDQGNNGSDNGTGNGGTSNGGTDNGGSDNGTVDDGLNPGPITSTNGESVYVPSGGVATGGGPA